jgi:CSLREA domain-containing protein
MLKSSTTLYIEENLGVPDSLGNVQLMGDNLILNRTSSSDDTSSLLPLFQGSTVSSNEQEKGVSTGDSPVLSLIKSPLLSNVVIESAVVPTLYFSEGGETASNLAASTVPLTLIVTTLVDEDDGNLNGDISLREAIKYIDAGGTINFSSKLKDGTIVLSLGNLKIDKNLTVNGLGANQLTVSGNNQFSVFSIDDGDLNNVLKVAINGLTVANGNTSGQGGGVFNNAEDVTLTYMTIADSKALQSGGGGIYNKGTLSLSYSTLSGNSGNNGGAIANPGTLKILNSTLSGNSGGLGSAISSRGKLGIFNSTITDNSSEGYAIDNNRDGTIEIANSIVAQNGNNKDVKGTFASKGYNLIGNQDSSSGWLTTDKVGDSTAPLDPRLRPLADNGGPTLTHALIVNSPAINAGSNSLIPANTAYDQRGSGFPRIVTGTVEIGSFEASFEPRSQSSPAPEELTTANSDIEAAAAAATLTFSAATYATDDGPKSVEVAEMNGDGWQDIIVSNRYANTVSVLLNNGDGTFASHVDYATGAGPLSLTHEDFNGDGFTDVATANSLSNDVSVLLGNGAGVLTLSSTLGSPGSPHSVCCGDFNGDGKVDLAVANATGDTVNIFMNGGNDAAGNPSFTLSSTMSVADGPWDINCYDLNADGKLDLVTANSNSNNISILLNNGDGTFASPVDYAVGKFP